MNKLKIYLLISVLSLYNPIGAQNPVKKTPLNSNNTKNTTTTVSKEKERPFQYQNGDLLFQQLQCGDLCNAIHTVTTGAHNANFSHVAILVIKPDETYVIEAIDNSVHKTPLDIFLQRSLDKQGKPLVAVGRLRSNDRQLANMAAMNAAMYLGRPYNDEFDWNSPNMYCSQLVLKAYSIEGNTLFPNVIQPMTFMDPKTHKPDKTWVQYFAKLGKPLPEGKPGCNPGALSRDALITMFFPYSQFN